MQNFRALSMWADACKQCQMNSLLGAFFDFVVTSVQFVIEMDLFVWKKKNPQQETTQQQQQKSTKHKTQKALCGCIFDT